PDELLYDLKVAGRHVKLSCWGAGLMTAGLWAGGTLQVLARSSFAAGANLAGAAAPALLLQAAGLALLLAGQLFFVGIVAKAAAVRGRGELPGVAPRPSGGYTRGPRFEADLTRAGFPAGPVFFVQAPA